MPGRQITDLIRQMHLIQDYVDETDSTGVILLLDMEKAFDRCSWDFLKKSMRTMGIEENMMKWIEMIYNEDTPPSRSLKINGFKGESFKLGSGVAQGCPLSPLLFLFIGEPLTRAIEADEELEGITIGDYEHRVSQFADDTAAYLKDISQSKRLMEIVGVWEDATAMRANRAKTAIIPIGKTVRDFNRDKQELTRLLNEIGLPGPSEEEWEIYLGAPIASDKKVYKTFLEKKYLSMKKKLSQWKGLNGLTAHGRTIVANFLIFSQLRYWAQLMVIPEKIMKWIDKDAQALLWNKEIQFEEGERGTEKVNKRFMRQGSEYNSKQDLGLGLLHWRDHIKAIQARALLNYADG